MTYLALARKWRPKIFSEVVGQSHVVKALTNALDNDRVHHAFLFSGTRGVGKTTLARIFAKSLNCEQGESSQPCQQCNACLSIDEGRYIDLIEVDAASRTKVDDTRELLENVQYAPTTGKYKVYLIDEVHMLSGHSFNALLKTLEEPPEHVKFLFATTDPQKLPVTVLSRCLQFNLRALRVDQITNQLVKILDNESTKFDQTALDLIAKGANGSMRDGLSLLDQAISQGGGEVRLDDVQSMLGTIKTEHIEQILSALAAQDANGIMQVITDMSDHAVDFEMALDEVLMSLYQISLVQIAPQSADSDSPLIEQLAKKISREDIQLYYQIGLISKRDIALAPNLKVGFEMALLRMLVFDPESGGSSSTTEVHSVPAVAPPITTPASTPATQSTATPNSTVPQQIKQQQVKQVNVEPAKVNQEKETVVANQPVKSSAIAAVTLAGNNEWGELIEQSNLSGTAKELAMNCACEKLAQDKIQLTLNPDNKFLFKPARQNEITEAIQQLQQSAIELVIEIEASDKETPAQCLARLGAQQLEQTRNDLQSEPGIQALMQQFDATMNETSIKPRNLS